MNYLSSILSICFIALLNLSLQGQQGRAPTCNGRFTNNITNANLRSGTPTSRDQDIDRAFGFQSIWAGGQLADFYASNTQPNSALPIPLPADENYVSCWIAHEVNNGIGKREGFQCQLRTPIFRNSGGYIFSFDMACLAGWGEVEVAVYGLYNPSNTKSANPPTGAFTPSNTNLFSASSVILLGTIPVSSFNCSVNKSRPFVGFNSGIPGFPALGITHIFITHSDNQQIRGERYMAFSDFCLPISTPIACPSITSEFAACTFEDANADGVFDYEYTFTVSPNTGSTVLSSSCGTFSQNQISFNQSSNTYTVTFYPNSPACGFSAQHLLSGTNPNCSSHTSEPLVSPCPGGGGGFNPIIVTPNPASDQIQVRWDPREMPNKISMDIFNSSGIKVQSLEKISSLNRQIILNIADLSSGFYYIKLQGANYQPAPIKFIKY